MGLYAVCEEKLNNQDRALGPFCSSSPVPIIFVILSRNIVNTEFRCDDSNKCEFSTKSGILLSLYISLKMGSKHSQLLELEG